MYYSPSVDLLRKAEEWIKMGYHPNIVQLFRLQSFSIPGFLVEKLEPKTLKDLI